jgi:phytanoyl-CoA hydroxylase
MLQNITDEQARFFVEQGYLVVPGLVSADEVEVGRAEALAFARGDYPISNPPDLPADATDEERVSAMLAVHFPHWVSDASLGFVRHAGICDVLSRITGAHLPYWDGRVKCMQSMLFLKPPGLQGQAWHQDERFIPTRDRSLVGAWIALDDADLENGCLWVLPGSHRMGYLHPTREHGNREEFDASDEAYGFDASGEVAVAVKAGDVVFFNGYLLHRSFRNRSGRTRRALVNHYMNAWSLLPWMMGKGVDVGREDYRTVVPAVGDDPYEWKGYTAAPDKSFVRPHPGSTLRSDAVNHIDTSITIDAPVEVVWSVLADIASYGTWNPYIRSVQGQVEPGAVLEVAAIPTGMTDELNYPVTVLAVEAPTLMVWEGGMPDPVQLRTEHRWELSALDGGTLLHHHEYFRGAKATEMLDAMRDIITTDFGRFNEALKAEAERRSGGRPAWRPGPSSPMPNAAADWPNAIGSPHRAAPAMPSRSRVHSSRCTQPTRRPSI